MKGTLLSSLPKGSGKAGSRLRRGARARRGWVGFLLKNGEPQALDDGRQLRMDKGVSAAARSGSARTNIMEKRAVRSLTAKTVKMAKARRRSSRRRSSSTTRGSVREKFRRAGAGEDRRGGRFLAQVRSSSRSTRRVEGGKGAKYPTGYSWRPPRSREVTMSNSYGAETGGRIPRIHFFGILTAIEGGQVPEDDPAGGDREGWRW